MIYPENTDRVLCQLEQIVETLGIKVRYEVLENGTDSPQIQSGYCRLRENHLLLIDSRLPPMARCHLLAGELKRFDLSSIFIPPGVRLLIQGKEGDF